MTELDKNCSNCNYNIKCPDGNPCCGTNGIMNKWEPKRNYEEEIQQLKEALRKFNDGEKCYSCGNRLSLYIDSEHTDDCEYIQLTK